MDAPERPDSNPDTTVHVRRALAGESESMSWLVARFSPLLLAQAEHRLGPHLRRLYDPEDLVQEVWAIALTRLEGLADRDGRHTPVVLKFLSTTLLYRVSNLLQRHLRSPGLRDPEMGTRFSQLPDSASQAISRALRDERHHAVHEAIVRLPELDRQIVVLRGIEQNSVEEVAVQLQMKANTVTVRYRRALARLREKLPDSVFGDLSE